MVRGFGLSVAAEAVGQASVGPAIGVDHQDHPPGAVQAHGFTNLIEDKLAVGLKLRRGQRLGAAGNFDRVSVHYADAFEEFAKTQVETVIEAPQDGRIALVSLARRLEVK